MAVPKHRDIMLPMLKLAADGASHKLADLLDPLAIGLHLSEAERRELLPSGLEPRFENRVHWAKTYLVKARLLVQPGRGQIQLTDRGRAVLAENPPELTDQYLRRFDEFRAFSGTATAPSTQSAATPADEAHSATPQEQLADAYATLRQQLSDDLLEKLAATPPAFFERLVVRLIVAMGYGGSLKDAGEAVGRSGDGGIDGIIKEDKLGLDAVYIQAKRWATPVGRPEVQHFAGSLEGVRARKGILITTSQFTQTARDYVRNIEKKIVLIDGGQLAGHLIDHGIGVSPLETYVVCKVDEDYFESD